MLKKIQKTITMPHLPQVIFPYIADMTKHPFFTTLKKVQPNSGNGYINSTYDIANENKTTLIKITKYESPHLFAYEDTKLTQKNEIGYQIDQIGNYSSVTAYMQIETESFGGLFSPSIGIKEENELEKNLIRLKDHIENTKNIQQATIEITSQSADLEILFGASDADIKSKYKKRNY